MSREKIFAEAARASADALVEVADQMMHVSRDDLLSGNIEKLLAVFGTIATGFTQHFVVACLKAVLTPKNSTDQYLQILQRLLRNPLANAMNVLRIATQLESNDGQYSSTNDHEFVISRYRDALRSFDAAAHNAPKAELAAIEFYRGLTSMKIPGGGGEAKIHFRNFESHCLLVASHRKAVAKQKRTEAKSLRDKASEIQITYAKGLGAGTFVAMAAFEDQTEKEGFLFAACRLERQAIELDQDAETLEISAQGVQLLMRGCG